MTNNTMSYIGKIRERINVYVNVDLRFNDEYIVFGRKTNQNESRVHKERSELTNMAPSSNDLGISLRRSIASIMGAEKSFSKIHFMIGKRPFWRKPLNI